MSLLIPKNMANMLRRRPKPRLGSYIVYSAISDQAVTIPRLVQSLGRFRRSDVIRLMCSIWARIGATEFTDDTTQVDLSQWLLAPDLFNKVMGLRAEEKRMPIFVFHRRQLWLLLQLALLACSDDALESEEGALLTSIGESALMASDILQQIEAPGLRPSHTDSPNESTALLAIPLLEGIEGPEILARAQSFWFDFPRTTAIRNRFDELEMESFEERFALMYGLSLREFFLFLMSLSTGFRWDPAENMSPQLFDQSVLLDLFAADDVKRALALISQTPDELAVRLLREPRQNWSLDASPLLRAPVLQVLPGRFACPDPSLVYRFLIDGIYYLLKDAYPDNKFSQLFGYIFEEYINGQIREFSSESNTIRRTFYPSPFFMGTEHEAGDGLILQDNVAVLMEYKARVMTTRDKYSGNREVTLKAIDDILNQNKKRGKKGVAQLAKSLAKILRGDRLAVGPAEVPDLSACKLLVPVVVTYEEEVAINAIQQEAERDLHGALIDEGADLARLGPLLVLSIDDVEALATLAQKYPVRQIIEEYTKHVREHPSDRIGNFRTFISTQFGTVTGVEPWVTREANRIYKEVIDVLEKRNRSNCPPV